MAFMRKVSELKENPMSIKIYGEQEDISDLLESIPRCGGIITPLLVKPDGTIISGHRRYRAAKRLGLEAVPCEGCDPATPEDEMVLIVDTNKSREKTIAQKFEEGQKLTEALAELAHIRKSQNLKYNSSNPDKINPIECATVAHSINGAISAPQSGRTSAAVAEALGFSDRTWQRLQYIGRYAQMRNSVAMDAMAQLNAGKLPIGKAYNLVRASLKLSEGQEPDAPKTPYEQFDEDFCQADQHLAGLFKIFEGFLEVDTPEHPTDIHHWEEFGYDMQGLIDILKKLEDIRLQRRERNNKTTDGGAAIGD